MAPGSHQQGFTYVAVLAAMTMIALASASVMQHVSMQAQRDREAELLRVGDAYARAIASYYHSSPGSRKSYPASLGELVNDTRFVTIKRHLREAYADPITRDAQWGLLRTPEGTIAGVHSLSDRPPIRTAAIELESGRLAPATRYSDWKFQFTPETQGSPAPRR